jgi:hypothetical protein
MSISLPPKVRGGGGILPTEYEYGLYSFNLLSNIFKKFFSESCLMSAFTKIFFGNLRMIEIGPS